MHEGVCAHRSKARFGIRVGTRRPYGRSEHEVRPALYMKPNTG